MTLSYQNKLFSFDPKISYRSRTLDELNSLCSVINDSKLNLSRGLQYYLRKYKELLDIPRLCRALAIPGNLAEQFIGIDKPRQYLDGLDKLSQITNQISIVLDDYVKDRSGNFAKTELTTKQKDAIYTDINELSVYLKMYYDIESVKLDSLISDEYPSGNTFDHVVNIMKHGAIIIRFKYVSRNGSLPSQERVVSYHIMDIFENDNNNKSEKNIDNNKKVLGVHIEGDPKFSMYKKWGEGDDKLRPIYSEYENTIIRWGKDEAEEAALYRDKKYNNSEKEFLY